MPSCEKKLNEEPTDKKPAAKEPATKIADEDFNFLEPVEYPDFYSEYIVAEKVKYGDAVVAKVVSVYDGDTIKVNVNGWPAIIGNKISVRINGIDTPEMRDKREKIKYLANLARGFVERTLKDAKKVKLLNMQRDKYFRILADVEVDGDNLGDMLIIEKLAKSYDGGTKEAWTINDYNAFVKRQEQISFGPYYEPEAQLEAQRN